jgi:hypothetical protein
MKAKAANALALALGCLLALGLGEAALRVFAPQPTGPVWFAHDPVLGDLPVPGARGERSLPGIYRFSFTHDARGLRVVPAAAGSDAKRTLLVLGDSFTYGLGVLDDETFCNRLQESLGPAARVVNAGNPAKGTDYALRFFLARGEDLRPDRVLLGFTKNDFGDNARGTYFSPAPGGALVPRPLRDARSARRRLLERVPGFGALLARSHLVNFLRETAILLTVDWSRPGQPVFGPREDGPPAPLWVDPGREELTRRYLAALRDSVEKSGASLAVAYLPDARDCWLARKGRPLSPDEAAFRQIAADLGLRAFSLTSAFAASPEPLERLYLVEGHWTAAAHALAARVIRDELGGTDLRRDSR